MSVHATPLMTTALLPRESEHGEPLHLNTTPIPPSSPLPHADVHLCPGSHPRTPDATLHGTGRQRHSILVHIPKTGGTTLESWGLLHGRYLGVNVDRHNRTRPWNHSAVWQPCQYQKWNKECCSWWHMPPKWFDDLNETLPLLAVLRDPVDRAVSEARYQMRWRHRDYEDADGVWCRNETFDRYITQHLRLSEQSRFMDDCHWIPQLE